MGERSRGIHPAGLLTRTLADMVGQDVAMDLYLSDKVHSATAACEIRLVQAVATSVRSAHQLAYNLVRRRAPSAGANPRELLGGLRLLKGELPHSDRRVLALDAFAQAQSTAAKAFGDSKTPDAVFASSADPLTRSGLRKAVHAALQLSEEGRGEDRLHTHWREVVYKPEGVQPDDSSEDALMQLLQMLTKAQAGPSEIAAATADSVAQALVQEHRLEVTPLADQFTAMMMAEPDADVMATLMQAHVEPTADLQSEKVDEPQPTVVDAAVPCLLMLRHDSGIVGSQPPLVIAHSLLGDHKGYGRLWNVALQECDVYTLRHRGLSGAAAFALDRAGAMSMANEYGLALVAAFQCVPFDLMGASFGAVLASHVSCASESAGSRPQRLILVDPPPAVPTALPVPKMVTSLRTAAMGVLLIHLRIEMGASVWEQFPQLQKLPEEALACFVAAQCLPEDSGTATLRALAGRFHQLLPVYRQCRHAFHAFSANVEARADNNGSPTILMALSSERWPTFREMFPGAKEDALAQYGPSVSMQRPGKHIEMISRCLSNRDATFTGALERFLGVGFADVWWLVESLSTETKQAERVRPPTKPGPIVNGLVELLSSLSSSPAQEFAAASEANAVDVTAAVQQVRHLRLN